MDDFFLRAILAGCGVALVAGPLGSFVVWRRMAYFGDTLAHSALLGVALGLLLGTQSMAGILTVCVLVALLLAALQHQRRIATDTLLGILSHGALAFGLLALSFMEEVRVDLLGYLFGDILAVSVADLAWIYGGLVAIAGVLAVLWRRLLMITISEELAAIEGVPVAVVKMSFMLIMALVVATAMKVVGILLITSLLIVPAAAARRFAATPEQMAVLAALIGMLSVAGGLAMSLILDTPSGPSIVAVAVAGFALSLAGGAVFTNRS